MKIKCVKVLVLSSLFGFCGCMTSSEKKLESENVPPVVKNPHLGKPELAELELTLLAVTAAAPGLLRVNYSLSFARYETYVRYWLCRVDKPDECDPTESQPRIETYTDFEIPTGFSGELVLTMQPCIDSRLLDASAGNGCRQVKHATVKVAPVTEGVERHQLRLTAYSLASKIMSGGFALHHDLHSAEGAMLDELDGSAGAEFAQNLLNPNRARLQLQASRLMLTDPSAVDDLKHKIRELEALRRRYRSFMRRLAE